MVSGPVQGGKVMPTATTPAVICLCCNLNILFVHFYYVRSLAAVPVSITLLSSKIGTDRQQAVTEPKLGAETSILPLFHYRRGGA